MRAILAICLAEALTPASAHASGFEDTLAEIVSWVVLFVVPAVLLVTFWLVHILPEKIAEKRHHPQAKAIQVLCLLSLAFGGLLWPLAWLWAYTKPVFYKMAYGADVAKHEDVESPAAAERGHV
jgi:CBS domain containing-hemolysin-like protein